MNRQERPSGNGILSAIGWTPLVELTRHIELSGGHLHAKLEAFNPGGSAKDRPAKQMIETAMAAGLVHEGTTVIESTSGNMGIGLAQACRYYKLPLICVVDPRTQPQNLAMLKAFGAQVDMVTTPLQGDFLRARLARLCHLLETTPNSFWPNQYANLENPRAHQTGTIAEIDEQLGGAYDYIFVAVSSTGTLQGCQEFLQAHGRQARLIAVDAAGSVLFGGSPGPRLIPGLGAGRVPPLARDNMQTQVQRVSDLDCVVECRRLAYREAILAGGSGGGVLSAIRRMREQLAGQTVVAVLHDSGTRYLDTVYDDVWVEANLGLAADELASLVHADDQIPVEARQA
ncbi:putative siderophore biosynthesis protein SbnA [Pseudobythopirellula maris]|uniref:N-(2-amino-2-carboxyethyl)-L-glutamate synthase n=1 Tax=Pseudobythopirellula maris TaxID=2527991 RepID=A0A5C5ZT96_9BACT|nr:2,3-diaminopropionate biosynthesis protein SbnA [Pseudobythopirellula maris]TWT90285.1 putative siderophore biosynthesis protein SbnA [Pseudobythopirellula maris]